MKKTLVAIIGIVMLTIIAVPAAQAGSQDTVHFEYKSATLTPKAREKLESLALDLKHLSSVMVTSYVPQVGDINLNQDFATKRVQVVKDFLVTQGVSADVISTQTITGPISKSRMVEMSYGGGSAPSGGMAMTPPPPLPASEPAAAPPPPPQEPVISAEQEKTYDSGVTEEDVAGEKVGQTPSRWEY